MSATKQTNHPRTPGLANELRHLLRHSPPTPKHALALAAFLGLLLMAAPARTSESGVRKERRRHHWSPIDTQVTGEERHQLLFPFGNRGGTGTLQHPLRRKTDRTCALAVVSPHPVLLKFTAKQLESFWASSTVPNRLDVDQKRGQSAGAFVPSADGLQWPLQGFRTAENEHTKWISSLPSMERRLETLLGNASRLLANHDNKGARHELAKVGELVSAEWMPRVTAVYDAVQHGARLAAQPGFEHLSRRLQKKISLRFLKPGPLVADARRLRSATASIVGFAELGALEDTNPAELAASIQAIELNLKRLRNGGTSDGIESWEPQLARYLERRVLGQYAELATLPASYRAKYAIAVGTESLGNVQRANDFLQQLSMQVHKGFGAEAASLIRVVNKAEHLSSRPGFEHLFEHLFDTSIDRVRRVGSRVHDANNAAMGISGYASLATTAEDPETRKATIASIRQSISIARDILSGQDDQSANVYRVVDELAPGGKHLVQKGAPDGQPHQVKVNAQGDNLKLKLWVPGGHTTWSRIFTNLFRNAKLHGRADIVSVVYEKLENNGTKITVSDTGSGIPAALRRLSPVTGEPLLWTPGTKARHNGIGLPGVKRLVEGLGGSIELVGTEGATFEIVGPPVAGQTQTSS